MEETEVEGGNVTPCMVVALEALIVVVVRGLNMTVGWCFRGGLNVAIVRFMVEVGVAC